MSTFTPASLLKRAAAVCLATSILVMSPMAEAAKLAVAVNPMPDPLMSNLTIPADAATKGMWSGVQPWPLNGIHAALLPNGKIATYGTLPGKPAVQDGETYDVWNPYGGFTDWAHFQLPAVANVNSFCSTSAFLIDGSLLISGGIFANNVDKGSALVGALGSSVGGINGRLAADRYYATMITLTDGSPLIMGGSYPYLGGYADPQGAINNKYMTGMTPEIYSNYAWRSLVGAASRDAFGPDHQQFWYPRAWVAPNGKVFGISSDKIWTLDPSNNGTTTILGTFKTGADTTVKTAAAAPNTGPTSTAVMYEVGKILQVGGNGYANGQQTVSSNHATIFDINGTNPVITETASMSYGRQWAYATVLPNGIVAATGGSTFADQDGANAVTAAELWDPKTGKWTLGASGTNYRGYHSSAILLQNGALLINGGGAPGPVSNSNAEVYYPPYLFASVNGKSMLAPRPQVISLSAQAVIHAGSVQIEMSNSATIAKVVFIGLGQGTHSFDTGQRLIPAQFSQNASIVTVQAPASAKIAPPGYYQLVAIDANGVPAPGVIVAVGSGVAAPSTQPSIPVGASVQASTDAISPAWATCATENGTCTFSGTQTVRYGGNGIYVAKSLTGPAACNNATFGDPLAGTAKSCQLVVQASSSTANPYLTVGSSIGLQATNYPDRLLRHANFVAYLNQIGSTSSALDKADSSFTVRQGLAQASCFSLESKNYPGYFLRQQSYRLVLNKQDSTSAFPGDATFCARAALNGNADKSVLSLESFSNPGRYLRHRNFEFWLDAPDGSAGNAADASLKRITALN